jgi:hypothetical protein
LFCAKEIKTPCILDLLSHFFEEKLAVCARKVQKKKFKLGFSAKISIYVSIVSVFNILEKKFINAAPINFCYHGN